MISYKNYQISLLLKQQRDGLGWIARAIIFNEPNGAAVKALESTGQTLLLQERDAREKALQLAKAWIDQQVSPRSDGSPTQGFDPVVISSPETLTPSMVRDMHTLAGFLFHRPRKP